MEQKADVVVGGRMSCRLLGLTSDDLQAKQLTMLDWRVFAKIKPQELLRNAWHGKDRKVTAPNLSELTERFDQVGIGIHFLVALVN